MAAVVQLVDRVGASGQVLLDLNRALSSGVLLGARDQIELAATSMPEALQEGFHWSSAATGDEPSPLASRQVTVPVVIVAPSADGASAIASQLLALTSRRFVLKIQRHGATSPVWLRCMPCAPQLKTNVAAAGQPTSLIVGTITTTTEQYALGARVDVSAATITQDPSTGTPFVWDINNVPGDSLTPLVIRSTDSDLLNVVDRTYISGRRRGVPSNLAGLVVQAEAGTTATGTAPPTLSTVTSDSALSGGSGVRATYAAGAFGPWTVAVPFSSLIGVEAPGQYHLLVRIRRGGSCAGALFSLVGSVGSQRLVEAVTAAGNDTRIVDLGIVQVPTAMPPFMAAPESPSRASAPTVNVTVVKAADVAGSGTFDIDWVGLFPADQDAGMLEVATGYGSGVLALDGWDQQPRVFDAEPFTGTNPSAVGASGLAFVGSVPRLRPGANRLYVVSGLGITSGTTRAPGLALTVAASYWPRYRWLA